MSRAVFYCGSAGVGKSTLINRITGRELARVSHRMLKDGTEGVQLIADPSDPHLGHIDLPGLDSKNFPTRVTEQIQNQFPDTKLVAALVLSRQDGRITSFIDKFHAIKNDLIGNDATFAIIWTRDAKVSPENIADIQNEYPNAIMFEDGDVAGIRAFFADGLLFKRQNKVVAKEILASVAVQYAATARPSMTPPVAAKTPPFLLGPPAHLLYIQGFRDTVPSADPPLKTLVQKVLEIKKLSVGSVTSFQHWTAAEVKRLTPSSYTHYHLLGDAVVNMLAMHIVYASGEFGDLETMTDKITGNGVECAMPRFFRKHLQAAHDVLFPNEKGKISAHAMTDVVEALLALAMHSGKSGVRIFRFMITEFFVLVNMGKCVGK